MKQTINLFFLSAAIIFMTACNKELPQAEPIGPIKYGPSLLKIIDTASGLDYFRAALERANTFAHPSGTLKSLLGDSTKIFTLFAPDDAAFRRSFIVLGLPVAITSLQAFSPGKLDTVLRYHLIGGLQHKSDSITTAFPNQYLQSGLLLSAPSASVPFAYYMPIFTRKVSASQIYVNNVQLVKADIVAGQSAVHVISSLLLPPSRMLWHRVATDPDLTYFKAAIERADSGVAAPNRLQDILSTPNANFTLFAPVNAAFQNLLFAQTFQALRLKGADSATASATALALASTPDVFAHPAMGSILTPTAVKGLVVYHIINNTRIFTPNLKNEAKQLPTLLNNAVPTHPGVTVNAILDVSGYVSSATVKGAANSTPSNWKNNPRPEPAGTSDQMYVNGVLQMIDQVLRPQ